MDGAAAKDDGAGGTRVARAQLDGARPGPPGSRSQGLDTAQLLLTWRECWAAPLHLAVTHGPDAGWLVPLNREVTVGRHGSDLAIADPALDHHHLTLRPDTRGVVHVRDERTRNGTALLRPARRPGGRRRRERRLERALGRGDGSARAASAALSRAAGPGTRVTHRWRPIAVGDELVAGTSRLVVRAGPAHGVGTSGPGAAGGADGRGGAVRRGGDPAPRGRDDAGGRGRHRLMMLLTLLPAVAMLALMAGGGTSPALRWVMLGGIGVSVIMTLALGARGSRGGGPRGAGPIAWGRPGAAGESSASSGSTDPAALALRAAGLGRLDERWLSSDPGRGWVTGAGPATTEGPTPHPTIDLDGGTVLSGSGIVPGRPDPDGPFAATQRLAVTSTGLAVSGIGAGGVARWLRVQLDVAGHDNVRVLSGPSPAALPPGPWTRTDAAGRSGVAPTWRAVVRAALSPSRVPSELTTLLGRPTADGIASAWTAGPTWTDTLEVPIGLDPAGVPRTVDLVADGPHALIAGTTGSGKSELLAAWVVAMAVRHPPRRLQLLLVDYKGGATFASAAELPHTVGLLTDLDGAASDRALTALRAELRRREHLVTAAGARGVGELADPPARLVVVVDELRALVEDSPDRLGDLVRLATQGRSLGVHLVLATQRPNGVVNAQLRANVNLRLSLRVLDPSDSTDVIGVPDAAHLPLDPGGAYVQSGRSPARLQVAWLPGPAARELVALVGSAAEKVRRSRREDLLLTHRPWLPELPAVVERRALAALVGTGTVDEKAPARTAVLLVDEPERQRRSLWSWGDGVVVVSGEPRSGRTTALQTLAAVEVAAGRGCHVVSRAGWSPGRRTGATAAAAAAAAGTTVGTADPRRLQRLLTLLAQGADPDASVVIDDVEQVLDAVDAAAGPGAGQELLTTLLRSGHVHRVALATTTPHRWATFASHQVALRVRDVGAAGLAGVPRELVRAAAPPGRGVLLRGQEPLEVQVVLDTPAGTALSAGLDAAGSGLVLAPLPNHVRLADLVPANRGSVAPSSGPTPTWRPVLGVGGDDARPVTADLVAGRPWLVCGPASSGRSGVLRVVAAQCTDLVVLVSPDSPLESPVPPGAVVLVDDAELLDAATADALAELATTHRTVVATSATATQTVYRGIVASVAQARTVVALGGALPPHCAHARAARDPRGGVGRAVLVTGTGVVPLQIAHP